MDFVKKNWHWFAMGFVALLLLSALSGCDLDQTQDEAPTEQSGGPAESPPQEEL